MKPLTLPVTQLSLSLEVEGVYGTPDEWKTTDDANPSLFGYQLRTFVFEMQKGKIYPRELTPKQLREQQQKGKKGGKKDTKKQEGNTEEERIKRQQEEERVRQQQWTNKSLQDQKYREFEDPFKSPQLKFENNQKRQIISGKKLVILEQRITKDNGEWIYLIKSPIVTEDQLAKLKKTKPKTLANANDLNPVVMRGWIDYTPFLSSQTTSFSQRCQLIQVDKTAQSPQPNLEKTYIKISLSLQKSFVSIRDEVTGQILIPNPAQQQVVSDKIKSVRQLGCQIRLGIQSLAMQFSAMFWKQLNIYEDLKNMNYFINKKNDLTKRKQHFLYDFNVSGKYKILKDRLKKVIVHLCEKYFTQQIGAVKSFTGVTCSLKDQFYSQIYTFLVTKYKQILKQLIFQKKQSLKEVYVLSVQSQKKNIQQYLNQSIKQNIIQRVQRIIEEYNVLGLFKYGEKIYQQIIQEHPNNYEIKYKYSIYSIQHKLKTPQEILPLIEDYLSYHKDDTKARLQYLLLLMASESQDNCNKAWVLLRQLIQSQPLNPTKLTLASLLFGDFMKNELLAQKYLFYSERAFLQQKGVISMGNHKQNPLNSQLPSIKNLALYSQSLSKQQEDEIWISVLQLFLDLNLINVVEKIRQKIKSSKNIIFDLLKLNSLKDQGSIDKFLESSQQIYQSSQHPEVLQLISSYLLTHPNHQSQKYLKISLIKAKGQKQLEALLKLSFFYLQQKSYANSKACILKYLDKKPVNSGYSWRILGKIFFYSGTSQMELNNLDQALECLQKANIYDTFNEDNWLLLSKIYCLKKKYVMCNQCLNQYESMSGKVDQKWQSLLCSLKQSPSNEIIEEKMRKNLQERLTLQKVK